MRKFLALILILCLSVAAWAQSITPGGGGVGGGGGSGTMGQVTISTGQGGASTGTCSSSTSINCNVATALILGSTFTTSSTIASSDAGKYDLLNSASAATLTLNNLTAGQYIRVINENTGTWTLSAGTGSIIAGCTTVAQNQSAVIGFDGTNFQTYCGAGSGGSSPTQIITAGANITTSGTCSGTALACTVNSSGGSGSPSLVSHYFSGQWYTFYTFDSTSNNTANANTMYCYFGVVAGSVVIKELGAYVVTGVSGNAQFAIYKEDSTTAGQFDLVDSTGSVSTASSGTAISATVNNTTDTLSPGTLYAQCANNSGSATFLAWTTVTGLTSIVGETGINAGIQAYSASETLGTWPSTFLFSSLSALQAGRVPVVWLQVN